MGEKGGGERVLTLTLSVSYGDDLSPQGRGVKQVGIKIDTLKCVGCGACTLVCPVEVLYIDDMKARVKEGCISCGLCVDKCLWQAITLTEEEDNKKT